MSKSLCMTLSDLDTLSFHSYCCLYMWLCIYAVWERHIDCNLCTGTRLCNCAVPKHSWLLSMYVPVYLCSARVLTVNCYLCTCMCIYAVPEHYLLIAARDSIHRLSLDTHDHTDIIVTTLNDLDNVIALDVDLSQSRLYFTDVHHDVIRSRDVDIAFSAFTLSHDDWQCTEQVWKLATLCLSSSVP